MIEKFLKSKYFKYLLENYNEINKQRLAFNKRINSLLNRKTDELGTILKCHLIIEYHIDVYLEASYPTITNWKKTRLTFNQKLELINNKLTFVGMYYPALKCLNAIRNKFSHNISYLINPEDYKEIEKIMHLWHKAKGKELLMGIKLIEDFTLWVCGMFNIVTEGINKNAKTIGLSGYLSWLNEQQNE